MLVVRAIERCTGCGNASQGRINGERAVCIGCALIGAPPRDGSALLAYNGTVDRANATMMTLLMPRRGVGNMRSGRNELRKRLGPRVDQYNKFATALASQVRTLSAGAHGLVADMATRGIDANAFADNAFALFTDWDEKNDADKREQILVAARTLYEPLADKLGAYRARTIIIDALGPFDTMRDSALGRFVPRIGADETAEMISTEESNSSVLYETLFGPNSDVTGADGMRIVEALLTMFNEDGSTTCNPATVQPIDASLLRRARDKVQQLTKGKRYNTTRLEKELLKMFAADIRRGAQPGANAAIYAEGISSDLGRQRIVANSRERGTREWADFVAVAGDQFYRSDAALPPAVCRQSQADFVKANPGEVSYLTVADELVNMAAFFNKRVFEKEAIPSASDELLSPGGVIKIAKTPEYRQVAQDLQRVRASLISQLNVVCSEVGATVKQDKPLNGKAIVDSTLLTLFDRIWADTVPHAAPDNLTFAGVYAMYSRKPGTAAQRGAAMLKEFFAGKKA